MSKIYTGLQIAKYVDPEQSTDKDDLNYVPRNERQERVTQVGFDLKDVVTWNECTQEFYTYHDNRPKIVVEINNASDIILIENFKWFTSVMKEYREQNIFISIGKQ